MWFGRKKPKANASPSQAGQAPRRTSLRHASDAVTCVLGEVLDISASGVRVRCVGKPPFVPGGVSTIKLGYRGGRLSVTVQERWRKRKGLRTHEIGLKFVETSPSVKAAIDSLATFGFIHPLGGVSQTPNPKPKSRAKIRVTVDLPDYYGVLEISPDADPEQVHAAYRRLARRYHPDANKDPGTPQKFIGVCQAYQVLSDAKQRSSYDLRQAG